MKNNQITITIHEDALNAVKKLSLDLDKTVDELLEESIGHLIKKIKLHPGKLKTKNTKKPRKKNLF